MVLKKKNRKTNRRPREEEFTDCPRRRRRSPLGAVPLRYAQLLRTRLEEELMLTNQQFYLCQVLLFTLTKAFNIFFDSHLIYPLPPTATCSFSAVSRDKISLAYIVPQFYSCSPLLFGLLCSAPFPFSFFFFI